MKKKVLLILLIHIAIHGMAQVSFTLHQYDYYDYTVRSLKPSFSIYAAKDLGVQFKLTAFSVVNDKWGESLIGLAYNPAKWVAVEVECGIETNDQEYGYRRNEIRLAFLLSLTKDKFSFSGIYEYGSFNWLDLRMDYRLKQFAIGCMASEYYGAGPMIKYYLGKRPFYLWGSWLYNWASADKGVMAGMNLKF
jgi:hypothetical protein